MKKHNRHIFETLSPSDFLKTTDKASSLFKDFMKFPNSLGFDKKSGGFLVLHRQHAPSAFSEEIPVCIILKKLGYRVILLQELPHLKSVDVQINEDLFEIKQLSHAKNIKNAIVNHFRLAYKKADKLLIHINQTVSNEQLRGALYAAVKIYTSIKIIWIVKGEQLFQLERQVILTGKYQFTDKN